MSAPIKNTRLRMRLLQRERTASSPSPSASATLPPLSLLGEGLDAIVCKTRLRATTLAWRLLNPFGTPRPLQAYSPTPQARLDRYHDAALLFDRRSEHERLRRAALGFELRDHVRAHRSTYVRLLTARAARAPLPSTGENVIPFHRARQN